MGATGDLQSIFLRVTINVISSLEGQRKHQTTVSQFAKSQNVVVDITAYFMSLEVPLWV